MNADITIFGPISKITGDFPVSAVREVTSYLVEGSQFSKQFRKGVWDGRKHLYRVASGTFPTGLLDLVKHALETVNVAVTVTDKRVIRNSTR